MASFSGMAGEIRSSIESDQFDLAGYSESRVTDLISQAFGNGPLEAPTSMVRFTFVVGGGKLVRSKYTEELPKWMNAALRDCGYEYDNSAAETLDSQGYFKQQHDTGKNLIYIIVYPKITWRPESEKAAAEEEGELIDSSSPDYIVVAATLDVFQDIVDRKLEFWRQRKQCLMILQEAKAEFDAIEAKMVGGKPLDPVEQAKYEANSGEDNEKISYLQNEIKAMVDEGELLAAEKLEVLSNMGKNLREAEEAGQAKRVETISSRKAALEKIQPLEPRLRLGEKIQKFRLKLLSLKTLEEKQKSMSLTMADLQALGEKGEIEDSIEELERKSRCWFETDEDFAERCAYEIKLAEKAFAKKKPSLGATKKGTGLGSGGKKSSAPSSTARRAAPGSMSFASIGKKAVPAKAASFSSAFGGDDSD